MPEELTYKRAPVDLKKKQQQQLSNLSIMQSNIFDINGQRSG